MQIVFHMQSNTYACRDLSEICILTMACRYVPAPVKSYGIIGYIWGICAFAFNISFEVLEVLVLGDKVKVFCGIK